MDNTKALETQSVKSLLWAYAVPAVVSQVIASIYNIVDRVFLGQTVGALAIAGLAITMPIMNIVHAFGSLVGAGSSARMSIVLGRKDERWAEKILGNSVWLTIFFGVLFVLGGYLFMDPILHAFGASNATIAYARDYMVIVLPGMFLTTVTFNLCGLIRASGYPTKAMWIMAEVRCSTSFWMHFSSWFSIGALVEPLRLRPSRWRSLRSSRWRISSRKVLSSVSRNIAGRQSFTFSATSSPLVSVLSQ